MNGGLNEMLSTILENTDAASKLSELLTGTQDIAANATANQDIAANATASQDIAANATASQDITPLAQSEKQLRLRQKIDILTALMPLLGDEYSKKADTVIKALSAAIVILGFSEQKS